MFIKVSGYEKQTLIAFLSTEWYQNRFLPTLQDVIRPLVETLHLIQLIPSKTFLSFVIALVSDNNEAAPPLVKFFFGAHSFCQSVAFFDPSVSP